MPVAAARHATPFALTTVVSIAVATAANLALYAVGVGIEAALMIDPGVGEPDHRIVIGDVAWKTAVPLALSALATATIARRSVRWATIAMVAGAVVAAGSIPFVVMGAHDTATGVLLSCMHAVAGVAIVVIGTRALLDAKRRRSC